MIDSHCHLNLDPLSQEVNQHINQAQQSGVDQILIPGVSLETSQLGIKLAQKHQSLWTAVGIHPESSHILTQISHQQLQTELTQLTQKSDRVVALGEIGLDYYRLPDNPLDAKHVRAAQKKLLRLQLHLACQLQLPVILHVRRAQNDLLAILEKYYQDLPGFVLHCVSGSVEYLNQALAWGGYVSFAGNLTFKNAPELVSLAKAAPVDKILVETDSPFLHPNRGEWPNTPSQVKAVYQKLVEIKQVELDQLDNRISKNFQQLFQLKIDKV